MYKVIIYFLTKHKNKWHIIVKKNIIIISLSLHTLNLMSIIWTQIINKDTKYHYYQWIINRFSPTDVSFPLWLYIFNFKILFGQITIIYSNQSGAHQSNSDFDTSTSFQKECLNSYLKKIIGGIERKIHV